MNHFYNPLNAQGLSDVVDGHPSFLWATSGGNGYTWQSARSHQYNALTEASRDTRDAQMAKMLRDLGHVIHLIQDLSQPGHVRNDNHAKKKHIEAYGLRNIATLPFPRGSLDWRGAGFTQLEDFWNRKLYTRTGGPQPLNADYAARNGLGVATARLGLAEFTNGNLLSEDALYVEAVKDKALHGFPYPSLDASTDVAQVLAGLPATAQRTFLPDQTFGSQFFLAKVAYGIPVAKHAVLSYTAVKSLQKVGKIKIGISIKDDKVLEEYHSIMLPNAIQYSAGCLDYFFRGSIGIDVWRWTGEPDFRVAVSNSGTGPLVGGKFELFWDDAAGVRTKIMEWGNTRLPAANETATPAQRHSTRTFTKPPGFQAKSFTVVYKGTINVTKNPPADDLVDQDIAIAAARCSFPMGECVPSTVAFSDVIPGADTAYPLNGSYGLHEEGFGPPDTVNRNIPPGPLREHFFEVTENLNVTRTFHNADGEPDTVEKHAKIVVYNTVALPGWFVSVAGVPDSHDPVPPSFTRGFTNIFGWPPIVLPQVPIGNNLIRVSNMVPPDPVYGASGGTATIRLP